MTSLSFLTVSQVLLESPVATAAEKSSIHFALQLLGSLSFKDKIQFLWTWQDPLTELARWPCLREWEQYAVYGHGGTSANWKLLQPRNVLAAWRTLTKHGVEVPSARCPVPVGTDHREGGVGKGAAR